MSWVDIFFSLHGRLSRRDYWLRFLLPVFGGFILLFIALPLPDQATFPTQEELEKNSWLWLAINPAQLVLLAVVNISAIAPGVKRCHDRDRSGWFFLLYFVPLVQFWVVAELLFLRGTRGGNRFGPDPREMRPQPV